ncbi:MAG: D-alanyl-D-alanine carboxypeptidase [Nitrosomonas sp.]|nr:D-alanyl-D-alanine carboxypeptidase [Nitrosomonas sp.]
MIKRVNTAASWYKIELLIITLLLALFSLRTVHADTLHASIVVDADTEQVLHELYADASRYPASLTKMMTLYMLFEALEQRRLRLDTRLYVSNHAASMPPTNINLRTGDTISVQEAILALIVRSANNVAAVVAEALGGNEISFGQMMTDKARQIGMYGTTFRNASGLPNSEQMTTARDMAKLSARLMNDFPQYYYYFSTPSFNFRGVTYNSHNRMVRNVYGVDGLKTGFIRASGFNIATSAKRNNRRVIVVVMGGESAALRDQQVLQLLEYSFNGGDFAKFAINDAIARSAAVAAQRVTYRFPAKETKLSSASLFDSKKRKQLSKSNTQKLFQKKAAKQSVKTTALSSDKAGKWEVQIGSYTQQEKAQAQAIAAKKWVSGSVVISEIAVSNRKLYRARLIGLHESQARTGCQHLSRQGMECLIVKPHG